MTDATDRTPEPAPAEGGNRRAARRPYSPPAVVSVDKLEVVAGPCGKTEDSLCHVNTPPISS